MTEMQIWGAYLRALLARRQRDQGGEIVQSVIWIALFAAAAIAIAGIIIAKFTAKAKSIPSG